MSEPSDRQLVVDTRRGDDAAYGELVRRYQNSVFNVCYRLLGERRDAEDLMQEAFLRAYQRLSSFDEQRPFGPWIRRVATNLCYNHFNKKRPVSFELEDEFDIAENKPSKNPEKAQQSAETAEEVRAAILELPVNYRAVIELRHFQELSYKEIATTLEIPISDVKSHLFRGRKLLAERLQI